MKDYKLTPNQQAFVDEYIANKGNGTQAYLKAYPNVTKESTAAQSASRLLRNVKVSNYLTDRTKEILEAQKMNADEIIIELVSIARRELKVAYFEEYDHLSEEVMQKVTRKFQPSVEEANKALETLVKWAGLDNPNNDLARKKLELEIKSKEHELNQIEKNLSADDEKVLFVDSKEEMRKWLNEYSD